MLLEGRTALVTAGSRGIGAGTARALARHGADVAVNFHRNAEAAGAVVADVEAAGSRGLAVPADLTDDDAVAAMSTRVREELGPVDLLVANAVGDIDVLLEGRGRSALDDVEGVVAATTAQLRCVLHACRHVVPQMREVGGGSIVLIGAGATHASSTPIGFPSLSVAKRALDGLGHVLASELGPHGIRVNVVGPGFVPTDANAGPHQQQMRDGAVARAVLGDVPSTDDVGETVAAVASDLFARTTGGFVAVDGGTTMV